MSVTGNHPSIVKYVWRGPSTLYPHKPTLYTFTMCNPQHHSKDVQPLPALLCHDNRHPAVGSAAMRHTHR